MATAMPMGPARAAALREPAKAAPPTKARPSICDETAEATIVATFKLAMDNAVLTVAPATEPLPMLRNVAILVMPRSSSTRLRSASDIFSKACLKMRISMACSISCKGSLSENWALAFLATS
ncbi:hypothetical protein D3C78_1667140 [compost metagenome]